MSAKKRAKKILNILRSVYQRQPDSFVVWSNTLELVIATVLSAQCTDKRVNMVTKELFKKYRTADDYAEASLEDLQEEIGSITFYKSKSKYLKGIGEILVEKYNGEVPQTLKELQELPGVAKKTASLVLAKGFGKLHGVAVDTHVKRVAPQLGLTQHTDPNKISADLEELMDDEDYLDINEFLILHGRAVCKPRKPLCGECPVRDLCPSADTFE